jgi:hypothetical protein
LNNQLPPATAQTSVVPVDIDNEDEDSIPVILFPNDNYMKHVLQSMLGILLD